MLFFQYKVYLPNGKVSSGNVEALTARKARDQLRGQGFSVISVKEVSIVERKVKLSKKELFQFTRELSQMLQAKFPLYDSLKLLLQVSKKGSRSVLIHFLCDKIKEGGTFSEAMDEFPEEFPVLYRKMIKVGEETGKLGEVMTVLSKGIKKELDFQKKFITALAYPFIVFCFAFLVLGTLLFYVVPSLKVLFEGSEVGGVTYLIFTLSDLLTNHFIALLVFFTISVVGGVFMLKSDFFRYYWESIILKVPGIRSFVVYRAMFRMIQSFCILQNSGVSLVDTLLLGKSRLGNHFLESDMNKVCEEVSEGKSLSKSMALLVWCPDFIKRVVAIGEESGSLLNAFEHSLIYFEEENDKVVTRFLTLLTPIVLIVTGFFVACVMLGVLLPLTDGSALI